MQGDEDVGKVAAAVPVIICIFASFSLCLPFCLSLCVCLSLTVSSESILMLFWQLARLALASFGVKKTQFQIFDELLFPRLIRKLEIRSMERGTCPIAPLILWVTSLTPRVT